VPEHELARAFNRQSLGRRALIVLAGPVANFLLAIGLYAALGWSGTQEPAALLAQPAMGTPAAAAGIAAGDRVVEVDGRSIRSLNEFRLRLIDPVVEKRPATITVERSGQRVQVSLATASLGAEALETDFLRTLGLEIAAGAVVVGSVLPDGSAARAGLLAGDQILSMTDRPSHAPVRWLSICVRDRARRSGWKLRDPVLFSRLPWCLKHRSLIGLKTRAGPSAGSGRPCRAELRWLKSARALSAG
jgi:regulator of sigma E protease